MSPFPDIDYVDPRGPQLNQVYKAFDEVLWRDQIFTTVFDIYRLMGFAKAVSNYGFYPVSGYQNNNLARLTYPKTSGGVCGAGDFAQTPYTCLQAFPTLQAGAEAMIRAIQRAGYLQNFYNYPVLERAAELSLVLNIQRGDPSTDGTITLDRFYEIMNRIAYASYLAQTYFLGSYNLPDLPTALWYSDGSAADKVARWNGVQRDDDYGDSPAGGSAGSDTNEGSGASSGLLIGGAVAALAAVVYFGTRKR